MSTKKKQGPTRVQGYAGPCSTLTGSYRLLSLVGDPHDYIVDVDEVEQWVNERQEVILFWIPADDVPRYKLMSESLLDTNLDPKKLRLVTKVLYHQPLGTSVDVEVHPRDTNESVAIVKAMKPPLFPEPKYEGMLPHWRMLVKHRDGGPKEYHLAFAPNLEEIQEDHLVRIFWVAKSDESAKKEAWALRVDVIGDVKYRGK